MNATEMTRRLSYTNPGTPTPTAYGGFAVAAGTSGTIWCKAEQLSESSLLSYGMPIGVVTYRFTCLKESAKTIEVGATLSFERRTLRMTSPVREIDRTFVEITAAEDKNVGGGIYIPDTVEYQVERLTIESVYGVSGNVSITIGGVTRSVAVDEEDTTSEIAEKIYATTFSGWTTAIGGSTVIFTASDSGYKGTPAFSAPGVCIGTITTQTTGR